MRKNIAAGNWKMNLTIKDAKVLVDDIIKGYESEYQGKAEVIFAPPFPFLSMIQQQVEGHDGIFVSAQNLHQEDKGAFTGEVSASMLSCIHVSHTLVGHSERRQYFNEDNALLGKKLDQALSNNLKPIFCIGETLDERQGGHTLQVIEQQVSESSFHLSAEEFSKMIIAYEPVWAIGTGITASPEQAQEVHKFIRDLIAGKYGQEVADNMTILYGGSVKPKNANELFAQPDIDGGLVGGASLKAPDFLEIIKALP